MPAGNRPSSRDAGKCPLFRFLYNKSELGYVTCRTEGVLFCGNVRGMAPLRAFRSCPSVTDWGRPGPSGALLFTPHQTTQPEIRVGPSPLFYALLWHIGTLSPTKCAGIEARCVFQHHQRLIEPLCEFRVGGRLPLLSFKPWLVTG